MPQRCYEYWLYAFALAHVLGGLALPWLIHTELFRYYNQTLYAALRLQDAPSQEAARFLLGLIGPTMASWGLLFFLVLRQGFARPTPAAWWLILLALLLWAPYDSWLSWRQGLPLNALINAVALLLVLPPLLLLRPYFLRARHD